MSMEEIIKHCFWEEHLGIGEIASMYKMKPSDVFDIVYDIKKV